MPFSLLWLIDKPYDNDKLNMHQSAEIRMVLAMPLLFVVLSMLSIVLAVTFVVMLLWQLFWQ